MMDSALNRCRKKRGRAAKIIVIALLTLRNLPGIEQREGSGIKFEQGVRITLICSTGIDRASSNINSTPCLINGGRHPDATADATSRHGHKRMLNRSS